jgi:carboxypeptidase C (cathepsin A)
MAALLLEEITSMSEIEFIMQGFRHLISRLKNDAENAKWLGPFQVASPKAIYQWAASTLNDNNEDWISVLAELSLSKSVILPDTATLDEIERYIQVGCQVELVANSGHMIAYDNPKISRLMRSVK